MATENLEQTIRRNISSVIVEEVTRCKEEIVTQAVADFERQVRKAVGMVAIDLTNYYSVERMGHDLVIRVQLEKSGRG